MYKGRPSERESRRFRKEQIAYELDDYLGNFRASGTSATPGTRGNDMQEIAGRRSDHHGQPVSGIYPLGDYVRKWLAETTQEFDLPSNLGPGTGKQIVSRHITPDGPSREFDFDSFPKVEDHFVNEERANTRYKEYKMLESTSESSFLEPRDTWESSPETLGAYKRDERTKRQERSKLRPQILRPILSNALIGSGNPLLTTPKAGVFEKQKRRKTREDRYEPRKAQKDSKRKVNRERKRCKVERAKPHPKIRKMGDDLMHQFSSKNVGHDHLTLRPSRTLGLFQNGRASSPRRWRGLPDLAFSEIEFLRHSKHRPTVLQEKARSKSREKERRAERAQNEISEYFRPSRPSHANVEIEKSSRRLQTRSADKGSRRLSQELMNEKSQPSSSRSASTSINSSKEFVGMSHKYQTFKQLMAIPRLRGRSVQAAVVEPDTARKLSDRETTYFTWSESAGPPDVFQNREAQSIVSTTPESIRQLLDNTGIFANTGIDRSADRRPDVTCKDLAQSEKSIKQQKRGGLPKCETTLFYSHESCHTEQQSHQPIQGHHSTREAPIKFQDNNSERRKCDAEVTHPPKTVTERNSPESGLQLHTTVREAVTQPHPSHIGISNQRTSRQLIAQAAYIRYALPIDTVSRGADDNNEATISTGGPEADTMASQRDNTEQAMNTKCIAETADYHQPPNSGVEKLERDGQAPDVDGALPRTANIDLGYPKSLESSTSGLSTGSRLNTFPGANQISSASQPLQVISDLPSEGSNANNEPIAGPNIVGNNHVVGGLQGFEGLPLRGVRLDKTRGRISLPRATSSPVVIESLYSRQLGNRVSCDLMNPNYDEGHPQNEIFNQFYNYAIESSQIEDYKPSNIYEEEGELINETASSQEFDEILSKTVDIRSCVMEEGESAQWILCHPDMSHQAAPRESIYDEARFTSSWDKMELPAPTADFREEAHYRYNSHKPTRSLEREQESEESHCMSGFWRPYRQY